jgi:hypothetical protein
LNKKKKEDGASNEMEEVEEERYTTPYVMKSMLKAIVINNKELIAEIERKSKELTRTSIRISHFLNRFVLKCFENNKDIPKLNNSFIQYVCSAVYGKYKNLNRKRKEMLNKISQYGRRIKSPFVLIF